MIERERITERESGRERVRDRERESYVKGLYLSRNDCWGYARILDVLEAYSKRKSVNSSKGLNYYSSVVSLCLLIDRPDTFTVNYESQLSSLDHAAPFPPDCE